MSQTRPRNLRFNPCSLVVPSVIHPSTITLKRYCPILGQVLQNLDIEPPTTPILLPILALMCVNLCRADINTPQPRGIRFMPIPLWMLQPEKKIARQRSDGGEIIRPVVGNAATV